MSCRIIHLLASIMFGTVDAVVPFRTFLSAIIFTAITPEFDIHAIGVVILPASGT